MKNIPFYPNRSDNMSCMLACFRSALEYLTGETWSWSKLEQMTGYKKNIAAWTIKFWTDLSTGFDIKMFEPFDYPRYFKEGDVYLRRYFSDSELKWQLNNSNIKDIKPLIPKFTKSVLQIHKSPSLEDIDALLDDGYLVFVQLNAKQLNDQTGYCAHMILVHGSNKEDYIFHDPGLTNAQKNRRVSKQKVFLAMGGPGNRSEVTGIKLK